MFGDVRAREAMIPRAEIDDVQLDDDVHTVARVAIETGRTRLPVHPPEGGLEDAVGVINAKDLLPLLIGEDREAKSAGWPARCARLRVGTRGRGAARDARRPPAPGAGPRRARHRDRADHDGGHPRGAGGGDHGRVRPQRPRAHPPRGGRPEDRRQPRRCS